MIQIKFFILTMVYFLALTGVVSDSRIGNNITQFLVMFVSAAVIAWSQAVQEMDVLKRMQIAMDLGLPSSSFQKIWFCSLASILVLTMAAKAWFFCAFALTIAMFCGFSASMKLEGSVDGE